MWYGTFMGIDTSSTDQPQRGEPRHERRRRETRDKIATTALTLFVERGYDAVTIAEIAETADVAKQTVVNHFPAKEDLLFVWHRPVEVDLIDMIEQLPLGASLPEFLKEELTRMFAHLPEAPQGAAGGDPRLAGGDPRLAGDDRLAGVATIIQNSPALRDALRLRGARHQENLASILSDRVPADLGAVAARGVAAFILTAVATMIEEAGPLMAEGRSPEQVSASLTAMTDWVLNTLRTAVGEPAGSPSSG